MASSLRPDRPVILSGTSKFGGLCPALLRFVFLSVGFGMGCFCSKATLMRSIASFSGTNLGKIAI